MCTLYIYYLYINTHTYTIYLEKYLHVYICINIIYIKNKYI